MDGMMPAFEIRRKGFHLLAGTTAGLLLYYNMFPAVGFAVLLVIGIILSLYQRHRDLPVVSWFVDFFDRDLHKRTFPGKGAITLLAGILAAAVLFPKPVALAAIITVTVGDTVTHLAGKYLGRIRNPWNSNKHVEGFAAGVVSSAALNMFFLPVVPAVVTAVVAMVVESLPIYSESVLLDDNFFIPLTVGITFAALQLVGVV